MPGFVIHIAIAKQYIKKHKNEIKDEKEFIKGIIKPDLNEEFTEVIKNKSTTHYGAWGNYEITTNIDQFLKDEKVDIKNDYWKGYLLHLLSDHYFYNIDFNEEMKQIIENNDKFYYDYDCLNKTLINKYEIEQMQNIKKYMNFFDGEPKYLKIDRIIRFIEKISDFNIEEQIKIIEEKGMEGLK